MKLSLLLTLALPVAMYAQSTVAGDSSNQYPNTFSSGSANIEKFNNSARQFRDWSISVGGGGAFMQSADLTSFYGGKVNWGYNIYLSLDKQISHAFGLSLQYQTGKTNQKGEANTKMWEQANLLYNGKVVNAGNWGVGEAWTKYNQISLLGDINFSNLFRRVDNKSPYRWALHGYAGIGLEGYKTYLKDTSPSTIKKANPLQIEQKLAIGSFFYQGGVGLKFNVSKLIDIETRLMYVITGDDEFDGGGWDSSTAPLNNPDNNITLQRQINSPYNFIRKNYSDNYFTANLGMSFKLGKHDTHLAWYDPLQNIYYRMSLLGEPKELIVCENGDNDNDAVCDDWDRQLDTPAGARVDGAGVAIDLDLDGVIDINDKCVTVPGPVENQGCPSMSKVVNAVDAINDYFQGIEFALNSDVIRSQSFQNLNHAADVIKTLSQSDRYLVVGCTDTRGSAEYNRNLSQKRADAVVAYLVKQGVNPDMLTPDGRGESDLKYPECDPFSKCPEWKNEANRRVYFIQKK